MSLKKDYSEQRFHVHIYFYPCAVQTALQFNLKPVVAAVFPYMSIAVNLLCVCGPAVCLFQDLWHKNGWDPLHHATYSIITTCHVACCIHSITSHRKPSCHRRGAQIYTFDSFTLRSLSHTLPPPLSLIQSNIQHLHYRAVWLLHALPNDHRLRVCRCSALHTDSFLCHSPRFPRLIRWLPLCVVQNGLLRCPEETIKWLSCFEAAGLSAGIVS